MVTFNEVFSWLNMSYIPNIPKTLSNLLSLFQYWNKISQFSNVSMSCNWQQVLNWRFRFIINLLESKWEDMDLYFTFSIILSTSPKIWNLYTSSLYVFSRQCPPSNKPIEKWLWLYQNQTIHLRRFCSPQSEILLTSFSAKVLNGCKHVINKFFSHHYKFVRDLFFQSIQLFPTQC